MKFTKEMLEKARAAENSLEIIELAKENNIEMTEEAANKFFYELHKSGELADDELDNVAGGCDDGTNPRYQNGQNVRYESKGSDGSKVILTGTIERFIFELVPGTIAEWGYVYEIYRKREGALETDFGQYEIDYVRESQILALA